MKAHGLATPADLTVGTRLSVALGRGVTTVVALIVVGAMTGLATFAYRYWQAQARCR